LFKNWRKIVHFFPRSHASRSLKNEIKFFSTVGLLFNTRGYPGEVRSSVSKRPFKTTSLMARPGLQSETTAIRVTRPTQAMAAALSQSRVHYLIDRQVFTDLLQLIRNCPFQPPDHGPILLNFIHLCWLMSQRPIDLASLGKVLKLLF
jgi:hypothetical protein